MIDLVGGGGSVVDVGGQRKLTITKNEHLCSISGVVGLWQPEKVHNYRKQAFVLVFGGYGLS